MGFPVRNSSPDGGTARLGAYYVGDPVRGEDGLLWETAMPCGGRNERCDVHGRQAEASMVGRQGHGGLTCMVLCGTVSAINGCGAPLARRLAMREPLAACGAGGVSCGGVYSLGGAGLVSLWPLWPRPLLGGRPPRSTLDF